MEIINFEDAKVRRQSKAGKWSKQKVIKQSSETNDDVSELQRQYREYAQFCNQWYEDCDRAG